MTSHFDRTHSQQDSESSDDVVLTSQDHNNHNNLSLNIVQLSFAVRMHLASRTKEP